MISDSEGAIVVVLGLLVVYSCAHDARDIYLCFIMVVRCNYGKSVLHFVVSVENDQSNN
jgi:hypothetical protein